MQVSYNTEVVDRLREEDPDILPTYTVDSVQIWSIIKVR